MPVQPFIVRYTLANGITSSTEVYAHTATDAVAITLGPEYARRVVSARLAVSPMGLSRAAYRVARDRAQGADEGFMLVLDAIAEARNVLRLPEDDYCPGAYPLSDEGSELDTACRMILEATPEEIDAAGIGPMASVRAR